MKTTKLQRSERKLAATEMPAKLHPTRRMLTRIQAAEYLGVSVATMARWAGQRSGPAFVKLGDAETAAVRYREDVLDEFIASRTKSPKP